MNRSRTGLAYIFSTNFPKHSVFKDAAIKNFEAINFFKKIYADDMVNQRMFKPIQIQISFDVVKVINHRRDMEFHYAWQSLKKFTEKCLLDGNEGEIYFFCAEQINKEK